MVASLAPSWKPEEEMSQGASQERSTPKDLSERVNIVIVTQNRAFSLITGNVGSIIAAAKQPSPVNVISRQESLLLQRISMESLSFTKKFCDNVSPSWIAHEIYGSLQEGSLDGLIKKLTEGIVRGEALRQHINMGDFAPTRVMYAGTDSTLYRLETLTRGTTLAEFTACGE